MASVRLHNLSMRYGNTVAVKDIDLQVESGTLAALLGPSGCGKTTTLRMIAGLIRPTQGDIRFEDRSVLAIPPERRGAVMVFQKHLLFPHMTVGENVAFGLKMRGERADAVRDKVGAMLAMVQLTGLENRRSHELSGGQQQRVALARALVIEPQVLLLDEPLANLDANLRLEMRRLIRRLQQELQMTTIFVTHDQEEAIMLADQVALMDHGELLQVGSPRALYEEPLAPDVARFFRNENLLPGLKRGAAVQVGEQRLRLDATRANACADGPVWVTVRPEHVRVCAASEHTGTGPDADNCLPVRRIGDVVYMGGYSQVQLQAGDRVWSAHIAPEASRELDACPHATALAMVLPRQHLWAMPRADFPVSFPAKNPR